jgi:hypothetical protein
MNRQLQIEEMSGYLAARYIGQYTVKAAWGKFELIAEYCERASKDKLLIDFTRAQADIHFVDRYFLGERSQVFARHRLKVAVVATREQIDPQKFGELVARNRGVNVLVFTELQAAEEWLLK